MASSEEVDPIHCLRCSTALDYIGVKRLHEGPGGGVFSGWNDQFMNKFDVDVYICRNCGKIEIFMKDVGEASRPRGMFG